jgi:hypothetical protein
MLSTVDSVLMAAMFTFMRDISSTWAREPVDWQRTGRPAHRALWWARAFGAVLLAVGIGAYVIVDSKGRAGDAFIGTLFAFYTAQLSMLPLVLGAMFLRTPPTGKLALPGLILSVIAGIGTGLYATFVAPSLQWWPVPICLGIGFVCYGIAWIAQRGRGEPNWRKD